MIFIVCVTWVSPVSRSGRDPPPSAGI
jgi:hypothetical protein